MAGLKNLTVTAATVKNKISGIVEYSNYMNNPDHPNHKRKNTQIWTFLSEPKNSTWCNRFIRKISDEALNLDLQNASKKGGRPVQSYAVSFDFTVPKNSIRPTMEQWRLIFKDVREFMKKELPELTNEHFYANIHDQDNPHMNLVISKVINGKRIRKVDQRAFLRGLKKVHSDSVLEHTGFDYRDYEPLQTNLGKRQKQWQLTQKSIEKALKQFSKLAEYIEVGNINRARSTENRIIKTLGNVDFSDAEKALDNLDLVTDPDFQNSVNRIKNELSSKKSKPKM